MRFVQHPKRTCWQLSMTSFTPGCRYEDARPPRYPRRSTSCTLKPASASAQAALIPATPPPMTVTLFIDLSSSELKSSSLPRKYRVNLHVDELCSRSHQRER